MGTSHTPGPWYCLTNRSPGQKQDHIVRSTPAKCEVARASEQFMARGERIANARIIAAAPDMLDALRALTHVRDAYLGGKAYDAAHINALKAIAKAEGRS
jgi:hypothetical protein